MKWIKVSPEQVQVARLEVQAFESAGLIPDPMVRKLAAAGAPKKFRAMRKSRRSAAQAEAHERAIADNRRLWDSVRAPDVSTGSSRGISAPAQTPLSSLASAMGADDHIPDELKVRAGAAYLLQRQRAGTERPQRSS
jgi:hypothetical protein